MDTKDPKTVYKSAWENADYVLKLSHQKSSHVANEDDLELEEVQTRKKSKYLLAGDGMNAAITPTTQIDSGSRFFWWREPVAAVEEYGELSEDDEKALDLLKEEADEKLEGTEEITWNFVNVHGEKREL